jgi:hypothetical protein
LVELVVVIGIIAILATVGFVSYTNYIAWARDTNRITQLSWISDALQAYKAKWWLVSLPTDKVEVRVNTEVIGYQWYLWVDTLSLVSYEKWWKDPKEQIYFSYYVTKDRGYYQVMSFLEEKRDDLSMKNVLWINQARATDYTKRYPIVYGDKLWILTDVSNNPIQEVATIKTAWYTDLSSWDANTKFIAYYNNAKNYAFSGSILAGKLKTLADPMYYGAPKSCPEGFMGVPWDANFNQKWFCVAQYEMTYSNLSNNPSNSWWNTYPYTTATNIASQPWYPITSITQNQAITACRSMGNWYHLITNNEWMTIARNIEMEEVNWSWWGLWNGWLYRGISEETTYGCDGNPDGEWGVPSTSMVCTKRILTLSNGAKIWDLAWNVWEHIDRSNTPTTTTAQVWNGDLCIASWYWYTNGNPATTCQTSYWPAIYVKWWVDIGMGYVRNSSWIDKIFRRWADANSGSNTWIFTLRLDWTRTDYDTTVGFRCAY